MILFSEKRNILRTAILTQEDLKFLEQEYIKQQAEIQKRLTAISFGMEFGFVDSNDPSDFLACEFLEVINKETGKIKFLFSGKEFEQ